ncbi:hypothetical protein EYF80_016933 [Liparis tanakae]|uniref:Uncharacterized protein n=1 Tax=Liparis tanakae TaxID=230148 RepID=A0A4Z2I6A4_9TELE|nr:hypothetical protein EYF80_016933 [Liparis tanakae]
MQRQQMVVAARPGLGIAPEEQTEGRRGKIPCCLSPKKTISLSREKERACYWKKKKKKKKKQKWW